MYSYHIMLLVLVLCIFAGFELGAISHNLKRIEQAINKYTATVENKSRPPP